jgi:hypothetical protein
MSSEKCCRGYSVFHGYLPLPKGEKNIQGNNKFVTMIDNGCLHSESTELKKNLSLELVPLLQEVCIWWCGTLVLSKILSLGWNATRILQQSHRQIPVPIITVIISFLNVPVACIWCWCALLFRNLRLGYLPNKQFIEAISAAQCRLTIQRLATMDAYWN